MVPIVLLANALWPKALFWAPVGAILAANAPNPTTVLEDIFPFPLPTVNPLTKRSLLKVSYPVNIWRVLTVVPPGSNATPPMPVIPLIALWTQAVVAIFVELSVDEGWL